MSDVSREEISPRLIGGYESNLGRTGIIALLIAVFPPKISGLMGPERLTLSPYKCIRIYSQKPLWQAIQAGPKGKGGGALSQSACI